MLSFEVCGNDRGLPGVLCPKDKIHGHIWDGSELPITLFPVLTNKTRALEVLFDLSDLVLKDGALGKNPNIARVQQQIMDSGLPEGE